MIEAIGRIKECDRQIRVELTSIADAMNTIMISESEWSKVWEETGAIDRIVWNFSVNFFTWRSIVGKLAKLARDSSDSEARIADSLAAIRDSVGEILLTAVRAEGTGLATAKKQCLEMLTQEYRRFLLEISCQKRFCSQTPDKEDIADYYELIDQNPSNSEYFCQLVKLD